MRGRPINGETAPGSLLRGHVDDDMQIDSGIRVRPETGGSLVILWGEIDASLRGEASAGMVEVIRRGGPVVVDTSDVTFIDSSGLAFILQVYRLAGEAGQRVILRDPAPLVLDLLAMIGLEGRLPVELTAGGAGLGLAPAGA